ncbi:MAG: hypothetical protein NZ951_01025 [Dehalococcoidia bacterium]|nr:hypothetical protein [Dehalococcoidia bacterium]MDW8119224.1 hypothetical protein [Chloroflexota bacterium]
MGAQEIHRAIAHLRLLIADLQGREEALRAACQQFRVQVRRLSRRALYGATSLDLSLASIGEVEERLETAEKTLARIVRLKQQAQEELHALQLTLSIEEAKGQLAELQARLRAGDTDITLSAEVHRLEAFIAERSQQAARTIAQPHEPSP